MYDTTNSPCRPERHPSKKGSKEGKWGRRDRCDGRGALSPRAKRELQRPGPTRCEIGTRIGSSAVGSKKTAYVGARRSLRFGTPPNVSRLSRGALKKNSFLNLSAPPDSSACRRPRNELIAQGCAHTHASVARQETRTGNRPTTSVR